MSIMYAALNPNINKEQLAKLIEQDAKNKEKLINIFTENLNRIKDPKDQLEYMRICMPLLISF